MSDPPAAAYREAVTMTDAIDIWENEGGAVDAPAEDGPVDVPVQGDAQPAAER